MSHKVANFPGITVDVGVGAMQALPDRQLVDFPGTYSLQAISAEEQVAVEQFERALDDPDVEQVLCVIDATRLEKSLYFTLQVIRDCQRSGKRVTVLANMIDVLDRTTCRSIRRVFRRAGGARCWPYPRAPAKVLRLW